MENVEEKCSLCDGLGERDIWVEPCGEITVLCYMCDGTGIEKEEKELLK